MSIDTPSTPSPLLESAQAAGADGKLDGASQLIPADNYPAMMNKLCPPLDELEVETEAYSIWNIDSWKKLEKKLHGPAFKCGDFEWRVLLFPAGNNSDHMSMYLECSAPPGYETPDEWAVCAQFGLVLSNVSDPTVYSEHHASHRFTPEEKDWGFTKFYDLRKLTTRHENRDIPIVEDDQVIITAYVRIISDPTGVLWHNFVNYNSKKETGFVGLKNQGATCYMNSLLQSLYFTRYFRKAVYQIPTDGEEPISSVPLALQRVFYQLQTSPHPVGTLELTRSFGWDTTDAFTQHDVQEFNRVLMDNLEGKMKGTKVDGALTELFVGQMKSFVKCINVDFESSRSEDFWDIQLNVKGMKNLADSFVDYVQVETLSGENQYQATGFGLQDAEKGVVFQSFPPVLHLQLKRFEYDFNRDMMVKINDRHEFPLEINLERYLSEDAPRDESWDYVLHGVLVHSGDLNAGHYYALLKPEKDGDWFKFDDDRVTRATLREVLEENYGEDPQQQPAAMPGQYGLRPLNKFSLKRHSNAYMLVYYRKSRIEQVLGNLATADTPSHLSQRLEREHKEEEARRREREEQHLYLQVKLINQHQFENYQGFDLAPWTDDAHVLEDYPVESRPLSFRVLKTSTLADLRQQVSKELDIANPASIRFWIMVGRQNKTIRPDIPIEENDFKTLEEIRERMSSKNADLRLWMEQAPVDPATGEPQPWQTDGNAAASKIVVFLKHFDAVAQTLKGVGHVVVGKTDKVWNLSHTINAMMGWPEGTPIKLYEEIKPAMIEAIKPKQTYKDAEIQDGDIICFQKQYSEQELAAVAGYHDVITFYDFLHNRILLTFKPRFANQPIQTEMELWFSKLDVYDQLAQKVAAHLQCDPTHIRFTTSHTSGVPRAVVKRVANMPLNQILQQGYLQNVSTMLFYEVLDVSLSELETKKVLKMTWLSDGVSQETTHELLVPKNGTMQDALELLKAKAGLTDEATAQVRIFAVHMNKIHKLLSLEHPVISVIESSQLYAEQLSPDDLDKGADDKYIQVYHFQKEPIRGHGVPFYFVIKPGERFAETKERLQRRMGADDKKFEKIKFALLQRASYSKPLYLDDDEVLYDVAKEDDLLGLDHLDKTSYKTGFRHERAIFIKN
ncbi:uncharacterized protein V1510DRAFT_420556 [Dipodascopsis tothii]|uniref:uncharacterized protein n=1 Tax=Dipodascopsis tothii TaxID=44089 RepID=UPI0034CFC4BF